MLGHLVTGQRQAVQTFVMDGPISQHHTVRQSYDAVAKAYMECFRDELDGKPLDRALLACLAEETEDSAPVADLGCGPGHVAAWPSWARHSVRSTGCCGPRALFLVAFHVGSEVRHLAKWMGHEVDVDFRFFESSDIAKAIEQAGFRVEMRLERLSYSQEVQTRRAYLLARRQP